MNNFGQYGDWRREIEKFVAVLAVVVVVGEPFYLPVTGLDWGQHIPDCQQNSEQDFVPIEAVQLPLDLKIQHDKGCFRHLWLVHGTP